MPIIDLTHTFVDAMPVYPGDPPARLLRNATLENCPLFSVSTGMHVGTHMDAPLHVFPDGADISQLPVEKLSGRGVLIDARGKQTIGVELLEGIELHAGDFVLILTDFSQWYGTDAYYRDYPEI
jgi:kynurenine formamidase